MKKIKALSILVLVLQLVLCSMAAHAELTWDVRAALTRQNGAGETVVNEGLIQLAQGVHQVFSGEVLRVSVVDALFDGRTLAVAWQLENLSEDQLVYMMFSETEDSVHWSYGPYGYSWADEFLEPGQVQNAMMDCWINEEASSDTMRVGLRYAVLAPVGYTPREDGGRLYLDDAFNQELSEQYQKLGECTLLDAMVGTGKFKLLEEVDVVFDLRVTERPISFLPSGEAAEKEYEDFTMRIAQADFTASTIVVIVQAVFKDEETANRYRDNNNFAFIMLNEAGELNWGNNSGWGGHTQGVEKRDDGTWVTEYWAYQFELDSLPEKVIISPMTPAIMEGVTLTVR